MLALVILEFLNNKTMAILIKSRIYHKITLKRPEIKSVFERKREKNMCISNSNQNQIRLNFLSFGPLTDVAQTCLRQCESVENRRA